MMKLLTSLLLIASASAFAPLSVSSRASSSSHLAMVDLSVLTEIAQTSGQEAIKVKVMACDNNECAMIDGWKDQSGRWCFTEPDDASPGWKQAREYSYKFIMMEIDDIE